MICEVDYLASTMPCLPHPLKSLFSLNLKAVCSNLLFLNTKLLTDAKQKKSVLLSHSAEDPPFSCDSTLVCLFTCTCGTALWILNKPIKGISLSGSWFRNMVDQVMLWMMCNGTHLMCQLVDFCKYGLKNTIILLCSRSPFHFPCQVLTWHTLNLHTTSSERRYCSIKPLVGDWFIGVLY